jgi:hypothetical protein
MIKGESPFTELLLSTQPEKPNPHDYEYLLRQMTEMPSDFREMTQMPSDFVGIAGTQFLLLHDSLHSFAATAATHTPLLQQRQHTLLCCNSGNTHSFAATAATHTPLLQQRQHTLLCRNSGNTHSFDSPLGSTA